MRDCLRETKEELKDQSRRDVGLHREEARTEMEKHREPRGSLRLSGLTWKSTGTQSEFKWRCKAKRIGPSVSTRRSSSLFISTSFASNCSATSRI